MSYDKCQCSVFDCIYGRTTDRFRIAQKLFFSRFFFSPPILNVVFKQLMNNKKTLTEIIYQICQSFNDNTWNAISILKLQDFRTPTITATHTHKKHIPFNKSWDLSNLLVRCSHQQWIRRDWTVESTVVKVGKLIKLLK